MKRSAAGRLARESSDMSAAEYAVFMTLLDRADNDTCVVPEWRTPSFQQLTTETKVSKSTVSYALVHLEQHGWLARERSKGGRGAKSSYTLVPSVISPCHCTKTVRSANRLAGSENSSPEAGNSSLSEPETVRADESFRRSDDAPHQGHLGEGVTGMAQNDEKTTAELDPMNVDASKRPKCVNPDCDKPARRACRTCWECAPQWELTA